MFGVCDHDRDILRRLAERKVRIASLPVHACTADEWARNNGLRRGKPMVWIDEVCWNEFDDEQLRPQVQDPFLRRVEITLRREIYQWEHMPVDMVVEPAVYCPMAIDDGLIGPEIEADRLKLDETSDIVSRRFHGQIRDENDLEKIRAPVVVHDEAESQRRYSLLMDAVGDIIAVEMRGRAGSWFAPWDELIQWWGVEEALADLTLRPELVHAAMDRLTGAWLARLDQWERLDVLSLNNCNVRVGSGGPGYTTELPSRRFNPAHVRAIDLWGCATAQIFGDVSPAMHEEFALNYERRWLDRFGLAYYGCCEPLHLKGEILRSIPNLRKVSVSPRADVAAAAESMGDRCVLSIKPNPAVLAADVWNPEAARRELREALSRARGCVAEIIMKDISTVRREPRRLWEWARIAAEVAEEF